jgi:GAF domain-containing protein
MPVGTSQQDLARELEHVAESAPTVEHLMTAIVRRLAERLEKYNWVGFYLLEPSTRELVLGPFVGAPTPHTRIPLDRGICGAAASSGETVVVDDVHSDPRYLSCSLETRPEIVVPIFVRGEVVGELDIDSHFPAAFGPDDRRLVEHCARLVGRYREQASA